MQLYLAIEIAMFFNGITTFPYVYTTESIQYDVWPLPLEAVVIATTVVTSVCIIFNHSLHGTELSDFSHVSHVFYAILTFFIPQKKRLFMTKIC